MGTTHQGLTYACMVWCGSGHKGRVDRREQRARVRAQERRRDTVDKGFCPKGKHLGVAATNHARVADANDRTVPGACSPRHLHRLLIVCVILLVSHSTQYLGPEGEGEGDRFGELGGLGDGGLGVGDEEGEGEGERPGGDGDVGGGGGVGLSGRMTKQPAHSTQVGLCGSRGVAGA